MYTQQGQFSTRVVCAHNRDSSAHGWSVHTTGTVQDMGGLCTQQGQFRTRVICAHNRDSSGHGWWVALVGTGGWHCWAQVGTSGHRCVT
ncbi:unnamed protein product, partial [Staurois parvus]